MSKTSSDDFRAAAEEKQSSLLSEIIGFLLENKKFWLIPFILVFVIIGALVFLGGTTAAPFIYTLF